MSSSNYSLATAYELEDYGTQFNLLFLIQASKPKIKILKSQVRSITTGEGGN